MKKFTRFIAAAIVATTLTTAMPVNVFAATYYNIPGASTVRIDERYDLSKAELLEEIPSGKAMVKGSKGNRVKLLQKALYAFNFYDGEIDGSYWNATRSAVRAYQKAAKLTVDGYAGNATVASINECIKIYNEKVIKARSEAKLDVEQTAVPNAADISAYYNKIFDIMYSPWSAKPAGFKTPYLYQESGVNKGFYSYNKYCGLFTAQKLLAKGVFSGQLDVNCNGNQWYTKLAEKYGNGALTSGGYEAFFYPNFNRNTEQMLWDIYNTGFTRQNILLCFPKSSSGSTEYGHVCVIDFITEDGTVHYSDSYRYNGVPEGWQHTCSIKEFARRYACYGAPTAVEFIKR